MRDPRHPVSSAGLAGADLLRLERIQDRKLRKARERGDRGWHGLGRLLLLWAVCISTLALSAASASASTTFDVRGAWHVYGELAQTEEITQMNLETGEFSGHGGEGQETWPVKGTVSGSSVTMTLGPYADLPAETATFTATLTPDGNTMTGAYSDNAGHSNVPVTMTRYTTGALSPLPSPIECISEVEKPDLSEAHQCGTLVPYGLNFAYQPQVSPDGQNVYSVAVNGDLIEYSRNLTDGGLAVIGCITSRPSIEGPCASENDVMGISVMQDPAAVAISPDGANVYVITQGSSNSVVEFARNHETGLLTEIGCISAEASGECATNGAKGLGVPYGITVSPDGDNVYVASLGEEAVAEFSRDPTTGLLTQLPAPHDCISSNPATGCGTDGALGLKEAIGVVVSPDGKNVYVAAGAKSEEGDIAAFSREPGTGALEQLGGEEACISELVAGCTPAKELRGSEDLAISPDGRNIYANSFTANAVVELQRDESTGVAHAAGRRQTPA